VAKPNINIVGKTKTGVFYGVQSLLALAGKDSKYIWNSVSIDNTILNTLKKAGISTRLRVVLSSMAGKI